MHRKTLSEQNPLQQTLLHNVQVTGLGVISVNSNSVGSQRQGVPVILSE